MLICALFFFNDTSTTGIYTYVHTLSLHDALPISHLRRGEMKTASHMDLAQVLAEPWQSKALFCWNINIAASNPDQAALHEALRRSEEHTSELQSLMRISYAVFCLKKKKQKNKHKKHETHTE